MKEISTAFDEFHSKFHVDAEQRRQIIDCERFLGGLLVEQVNDQSEDVKISFEEDVLPFCESLDLDPRFETLEDLAAATGGNLDFVRVDWSGLLEHIYEKIGRKDIVIAQNMYIEEAEME